MSALRSLRVSSSSDEVRSLAAGWQVTRTAAGAFATPAELAGVSWRDAVVPGTAAMVFGADAELASTDHFYRCTFERSARPGQRTLLELLGLATLAEVWLNGQRVAQHASMFTRCALDVSVALAPRNELCIAFRALLPELRKKRARGRWPAPLATEKNLRFVRTTLLGFMPGFTPEIVPVGPFRPVQLVEQRALCVERAHLATDFAGDAGEIDVNLVCVPLAGAEVSDARLVVAGGHAAKLNIEPLSAGRFALRGRQRLPGIAPWFPHTHGEPALHAAVVELRAGGELLRIELGRVGFRRVEVDRGRDGRGFALRVNGVPVFCRGASLAPLDATSLHVDRARYRGALERVRDAGMNMLRVNGVFVYESDELYAACDELGILVFQDFMFARMDYPFDDPAFAAESMRECEELLERLSGRPSLALLCGNTEVQAQAAMMGLEREAWRSPFFDEALPRLCAERAPGVPYVPSSPSGGDLPFRVGEGLSHYFGVSAFMRPVQDARLARVRFAAECLAFSTPPCEATLEAWLGDPRAAPADARYRERIPRDLGPSWNFADVSEHYVRTCFGVDAAALRESDPARYLALVRAAVAEVMAATIVAFRRGDSECGGALVWMLNDLHDAPGLGLIDARARPKLPFYALSRVLQPVAVFLTDDGLDGVRVHVHNDRPQALEARLEITLHRRTGTVVERAAHPLRVEAHAAVELGADALLGHFADSSYAFRFGAPSHTLVTARLLAAEPADGEAEVLSRAHYLPLGLAHELVASVGLWAKARPSPRGYELTLGSEQFAQSVAVHARGFLPSDDGFHLAPGEQRTLELVAESTRGGELEAVLRPLNALEATRVSCKR